MTPCEKLGYKVGDQFTVKEADEDWDFSKETVLELEEDDNSNNPLFKLIKGKCITRGFEDYKRVCIELERITPLQQNPTNKVGELVVDWKALQVGDQAVFEGFANLGLSSWEFTVGKVYTVGVDGDGDKGFLDDAYLTPESHYADAFKFRLTHKVSDTVEGKVEQSFPNYPFKIRNGDNPAVRQWLKDNGVVWLKGQVIDTYLKERGFLFINEKNAETCVRECFFDTQPEQEISINIQPAVVTGWEIVENISEKELQLKEKIAKLTIELEEAQEELNNL